MSEARNRRGTCAAGAVTGSADRKSGVIPVALHRFVSHCVPSGVYRQLEAYSLLHGFYRTDPIHAVCAKCGRINTWGQITREQADEALSRESCRANARAEARGTNVEPLHRTLSNVNEPRCPLSPSSSSVLFVSGFPFGVLD